METFWAVFESEGSLALFQLFVLVCSLCLFTCLIPLPEITLSHLPYETYNSISGENQSKIRFPAIL